MDERIERNFLERMFLNEKFLLAVQKDGISSSNPVILEKYERRKKNFVFHSWCFYLIQICSKHG